MNKQTGIIAIVALVLLVGGIFAFTVFGGSKPKGPAVTPTPPASYKEVDSSVQATLVPNNGKTKVTLTITGLSSRYTKIEYELSYMTDNNGAQGAFSNDPISIENQNEFIREVELGSCSTGGKCTYDKDVRDFNLSAKLYLPSGEIQILRKTFPTI
jgi:hypothetical protein